MTYLSRRPSLLLVLVIGILSVSVRLRLRTMTCASDSPTPCHPWVLQTVPKRNAERILHSATLTHSILNHKTGARFSGLVQSKKCNAMVASNTNTRVYLRASILDFLYRSFAPHCSHPLPYMIWLGHPQLGSSESCIAHSAGHEFKTLSKWLPGCGCTNRLAQSMASATSHL